MQKTIKPLCSDFSTKYDMYGNMIYKICVVYLADTSLSEDVTQEVFIKLFYYSPEFNDSEHEKRWIIRVTINLCKDTLKKISARKTVPLEDQREIALHQTDDDISEIIFNLPPKYKDVIHLHYYEGYSVNEISKILHISTSAVKMRLKRGRELLKIRLNEE